MINSILSRSGWWIRAVRVGAAMSLLFSGSVDPAEASYFIQRPPDTSEASLLRDLTPPPALGRVADYYDPQVSSSEFLVSSSDNSKLETRNQKLVVLIQDLHAHYEVQKNIAGLLEFLSQKLANRRAGVSASRRNTENAVFSDSLADTPTRRYADTTPFALAVEGAEGPVAVTELGKLPDKAWKTYVADRLLKAAELTGPEYYAIVNGKPDLLWGVEDRRYHKANLSLFQSTFKDKEDLARSLRKLRDDLKPLQERYYTRAMKKLAKRAADFQAGKVSFAEYLSALARQASRQGVDIARYYPELAHWTGFARQAKYVQADKLLTEQTSLLQETLKHLAKTDLQRNLIKTMDELEILQRFLTEQVTTEEIHKMVPELAKLFGHIRPLLEATGTRYDPKHLSALVQASLDFYGIALLRDKFLAENTLALLANRFGFRVASFGLKSKKHSPILQLETRNPKPETVVLVAGGFHTPGITQILKEKGVSYLVITPTLTTAHDRDLYNQRLLGKHVTAQAWGTRTMLSDDLEGPMLRSAGQAFGQSLRGRLGTMRNVMQRLKNSFIRGPVANYVIEGAVAGEGWTKKEIEKVIKQEETIDDLLIQLSIGKRFVPSAPRRAIDIAIEHYRKEKDDDALERIKNTLYHFLHMDDPDKEDASWQQMAIRYKDEKHFVIGYGANGQAYLPHPLIVQLVRIYDKVTDKASKTNDPAAWAPAEKVRAVIAHLIHHEARHAIDNVPWDVEEHRQEVEQIIAELTEVLEPKVIPGEELRYSIEVTPDGEEGHFITVESGHMRNKRMRYLLSQGNQLFLAPEKESTFIHVNDDLRRMVFAEIFDYIKFMNFLHRSSESSDSSTFRLNVHLEYSPYSLLVTINGDKAYRIDRRERSVTRLQDGQSPGDEITRNVISLAYAGLEFDDEIRPLLRVNRPNILEFAPSLLRWSIQARTERILTRVNSNNQAIGKVKEGHALRWGAWHRRVSILFYDPAKNQVFLERKTPLDPYSPGELDLPEAPVAAEENTTVRTALAEARKVIPDLSESSLLRIGSIGYEGGRTSIGYHNNVFRTMYVVVLTQDQIDSITHANESSESFWSKDDEKRIGAIKNYAEALAGDQGLSYPRSTPSEQQVWILKALERYTRGYKMLPLDEVIYAQESFDGLDDQEPNRFGEGISSFFGTEEVAKEQTTAIKKSAADYSETKRVTQLVAELGDAPSDSDNAVEDFLNGKISLEDAAAEADAQVALMAWWLFRQFPGIPHYNLVDEFKKYLKGEITAYDLFSLALEFGVTLDFSVLDEAVARLKQPDKIPMAPVKEEYLTEAPFVSVHLPLVYQHRFGVETSRVVVPETGETAKNVLRRMADDYPELRPHLFDEKGDILDRIELYPDENSGDEKVIPISRQAMIKPGAKLWLIPTTRGGDGKIDSRRFTDASGANPGFSEKRGERLRLRRLRFEMMLNVLKKNRSHLADDLENLRPSFHEDDPFKFKAAVRDLRVSRDEEEVLYWVFFGPDPEEEPASPATQNEPERLEFWPWTPETVKKIKPAGSSNLTEVLPLHSVRIPADPLRDGYPLRLYAPSKRYEVTFRYKEGRLILEQRQWTALGKEFVEPPHAIHATSPLHVGPVPMIHGDLDGPDYNLSYEADMHVYYDDDRDELILKRSPSGDPLWLDLEDTSALQASRKLASYRIGQVNWTIVEENLQILASHSFFESGNLQSHRDGMHYVISLQLDPVGKILSQKDKRTKPPLLLTLSVSPDREVTVHRIISRRPLPKTFIESLRVYNSARMRRNAISEEDIKMATEILDQEISLLEADRSIVRLYLQEGLSLNEAADLVSFGGRWAKDKARSILVRASIIAFNKINSNESIISDIQRYLERASISATDLYRHVRDVLDGTQRVSSPLAQRILLEASHFSHQIKESKFGQARLISNLGKIVPLLVMVVLASTFFDSSLWAQDLQGSLQIQAMPAPLMALSFPAVFVGLAGQSLMVAARWMKSFARRNEEKHRRKAIEEELVRSEKRNLLPLKNSWGDWAKTAFQGQRINPQAILWPFKSAA